MAKVKPVYSHSDPDHLVGYSFICPGCKTSHMPTVGKWTDKNEKQHTGWSFNGNVDAPTFSPSLLVHESKWPDGEIGQPRCHSFIRDGKIQFLGDCGHPLKNQTVDLADV